MQFQVTLILTTDNYIVTIIVDGVKGRCRQGQVFNSDVDRNIYPGMLDIILLQKN